MIKAGDLVKILRVTEADVGHAIGPVKSLEGHTLVTVAVTEKCCHFKHKGFWFYISKDNLELVFTV